MGIVAGYEIHLYCDAQIVCDGYGDPDKFAGDTKKEAKKAARNHGWSINERRDANGASEGRGRAVCPYCNEK